MTIQNWSNLLHCHNEVPSLSQWRVTVSGSANEGGRFRHGMERQHETSIFDVNWTK